MDLHEACENGNEERVLELLVYGDEWRRLLQLRRRLANVSSSLSVHRPSKILDESTSTGGHPSPGAAPLVPQPSINRGLNLVSEASHLVANAAASAAATATATLTQSPAQRLRARGTAGRTPLVAACIGAQLSVVRLLLGESCCVYFSSRTEDEARELLAPLVVEYESFMRLARPDMDATVDASVDASADDGWRDPALFQIKMVHRSDVGSAGADVVVPMALVRLTPSRSIAPQELLGGRCHVDDFGNTPLQCIGCFGSGATETHVDNGLEITKELLRHGDQPNLPKTANRWTPLHWAAYNGNHEQCALLLDPRAALPPRDHALVGPTQHAIPLMVDSDNLFAADIAGRRGLALVAEMAALRALPPHARDDRVRWRLRLDHVRVLQTFTHEFLAHASSLVTYVREMNARRPQLAPPAPTDASRALTSFAVELDALRLATRRRQHRDLRASRELPLFTCADAVRYGQHLLYWMGCFGLVREVQALLEMKFEVPTAAESGAQTTTTLTTTRVQLRPLYVCSCEENKLQSVLHAVAAHGQREIVALLLAQIVNEQRDPSVAAQIVPRTVPKLRKQTDHLARTHKGNAIVPSISSIASGSRRDETALKENDRDRLNVLTLVDSGWRNYRNESPLFLAALYLQDDVVRLFHRVLNAPSLAWELSNCNVEGSFVYHIASDGVRALLGIPPSRRGLNAEYVLLFDGLEKHHFKDSLVETLREESLSAPPLEVTSAGHRVTPARLCGLVRVRRTDYLLVGATEDMLVRHAHVLQLKIKHRGSSLRSPYNPREAARFEPFRSLQRQQVVRDIIQKNIHLATHLRRGNLLAIFPLHDASGCRNIMRAWAWRDHGRRVFLPFDGSGYMQFMTEDRTHQYEMLWPLLTYFGEKHAFYYAFLLFYSTWLLPVALLGTLCQFAASVPWLYARLAFVSPLFAVVVALWATIVVERWKRKRSEIQANFGNFTRNRNERAPTFYGDFLVPSPESPTVDLIFPQSLQLARIYLGLPLLLTMAGLAVALFIAVKLASSSRSVLRRVVPWLPPELASYVIPVINAVCMLVLDNIYTKVAVSLTVWENHRTVWQYESMLAVKLFGFKFLNAFISLFWVAFVDRDDVALRKQLVVIMGARQLWYAFKRHVVALLHVQHKWRRAGFSLRESEKTTASERRPWFSLSVEWYTVAELENDDAAGVSTPHAPPPIVRLQEEMYPPDFLLDKQMEVVLQFGYITMFVSVLPVAPMLALLGNVVFTRLDVICSTQVKRRPPFESETEVSTFMSILAFMSFAAVAVNCAVLFFTTRNDVETLLTLVIKAVWRQSAALSTASPENYIARLWVLLFLEHTVLALKAFVSLNLDDAAAWVQYDEGRQNKDAVTIQAHGERAQAALSQRLSERWDCGDDEQPRIASAEAGTGDGATENASPVAAPLSSYQRVLADKYAAALHEKNQALERENRMAQRLTECLREIEELKAKSQASTRQSNANETAEAETDGTESVLDSKTSVASPCNSKACVLCDLLSQTRLQTGVKRCLTCKRFFCDACDDLLHFDDLGVREDRHFRVSVPSSATATPTPSPSMTATLPSPIDDGKASNDKASRPATVPAMQPHRRRSPDEQQELVEIERLFRSVVDGSKWERKLATWTDVRQRLTLASAQDQALVLRYLRNAVRRHQRRTVDGGGAVHPWETE